MRYHKYKEKIQTKTGAWRYIYDTVKSGLTSSGEDYQSTEPESSDQNKEKKKKRVKITLPKKEDSKAMKEYKQKLSTDAANYLDTSQNPTFDASMQAHDVKKASENFKKSKKFKDLF